MSIRAMKSCSSATQGEDAMQTLDAREMAAAISTIPYEILCRLGSRVHRSYR